MLYNWVSQTVQLVILQTNKQTKNQKSNEVKEVSRKGKTISKWDTNLQANYLRPDLDNAKFSGSSFWVDKCSQLGCPCSKSLRNKLLFSEIIPKLEGHWCQHFSTEEKKITDIKSFLQTSVRSKIMAVGGHYNENEIYIYYLHPFERGFSVEISQRKAHREYKKDEKDSHSHICIAGMLIMCL